MKIEFIDLQRQYQNYKTEIDAQIQSVLRSNAFIMGEQVKQLEDALTSFVGCRYAIGCSSGTDALLLALRSYDVREGDEIITTPFSFIAASEVISLFNAKPIFVDIDVQTFNMDPQKIAAAITKKTRGIIAIDLYGQCADYDSINAIAQKHGLFVIDDAAQSLGARYKDRNVGTLADITCTSFFPAKPLGCYGDGGMVFTNDDRIAKIIRSLSLHGQGEEKYEHVYVGFNARLDTLQAAILLAKFKHFPKEIEFRNQAANYYNAQLKNLVSTPKVSNGYVSVYSQYSIRTPQRDRLKQFLNEHKIPTAIHYPKPLHLQKALSFLGHKPGDFPIAETVAQDILSLPMHPYITREEQDFIVGTIKEFCGKKN